MTAANDPAVRRALEMAGVEFIDENGGGQGVRLRKGQQKKHWKGRYCCIPVFGIVWFYDPIVRRRADPGVVSG
jgi:hypothetical protein